jgi:acyl transferase domain-containing protein
VTASGERDYAALLKRSLQAIDQLEARLAAAERARSEPIAIIGIACRFAGANDTEEFWRLLRDGVDAVTEVPPDRWDVDAVYDPDPDALGKSYTRWGSFLRDVVMFDAEFFGVSPREALKSDPQHRLLLEVAWEALENAAIAPSSLAGSQTAVHIGISAHDYAMRAHAAGGPRIADAYTASGGSHSIAAGRISYLLGLHGPNTAIDTACSSSLVAVHAAVQSLRAGEADLALTGGVNLTLTADGSIFTSRARMMSFDGRCKTFDASADGYVRGEGCGIIVLKRLSDAEQDGDTILAVIRGSAVNQDGRTSGLTAPNGAAQRAVVNAALANARLEPRDVSYVEAHGTGTSLGDPIEVRALGEVFSDRPAGRPLMLGSVKTNIGHTEGAAGIAGVIKTVLALQHRAIPPLLHLRNPNPLIAWDQYPVAVPTKLTPWESPDGVPRRAGVSSFGFSGTNAHVILEEAPPPPPSPEPKRGQHLLVLSAQTPAALSSLAQRWSQYLARPDAVALPDACATAALGRSHFAERLSLVAASSDEAREKLAAFAAGRAEPGVTAARASGGDEPEVVFMFTGQGAQYTGMARELYETEGVFAAALDECAAILRPLLERPLKDVLFEPDGAAALDDTAYTQPALFAVEYALAALWRSWGIEPTAVMGHSIGEYVAACIAGVFTLEDALRLIAARGRLMSELPRNGSMAAVFAGEEQVRRALAGHEEALSIAATNGPASTVISGRTDAVETVMARLVADGVQCQRLNVSHAFHSPLMEPMLDAFEAVASGVAFSPPAIGLVSNVTGALAGPEIATAAYWRRHIREPVRFAESIATLHREGYALFVEPGPHPTLIGMAKHCPGAERATWVTSLRKNRGDVTSMLEGLGQLYVRGVPVNWKATYADPANGRRRANLPAYAFQRSRYWEEFPADTGRAELARPRTHHPFLDGVVPVAIPTFQTELDLAGHPWLADHRIRSWILFPATGFLELSLAAAREVLQSGDCWLQDLAIEEPLVLTADAPVTIQITVVPGAGDTHTVSVFSRAAAGDAGEPARWRRHARSTVARNKGISARAGADVSSGTQPMDVDAYYARLAEMGAVYGPAFRGIRSFRKTDRGVAGEVQLPDTTAAAASGYLLHPALLDACIQLIGVAFLDGKGPAYLPAGAREYRVFRAGQSAASANVAISAPERGGRSFTADLTLFDANGDAIAELIGLRLDSSSRAVVERVAAVPVTDWLFETEWRADAGADVARGEAPGRWLVFADGTGVGTALAERLREHGADATVVLRGESFADAGDGTWHADAFDGAGLRELVRRAGAGPQGAITDIVYAWPLDAGVVASPAAPPTETPLETALRELLGAMQVICESGARVFFVARGAQAAARSIPDLLQAPAWSVAGVAAGEYPGARIVRIDLDPAGRADDIDRLFRSVWAPDDETQIAFRDGARHVARLASRKPRPAAERHQAWRLEIPTRGSLGNLTLAAVTREAPGPGEVEIRVRATGLNFRDVLNALGMYPGDPGPLGNECAGVVTAVGPDVDDFQVGDEVIAMVNRSFATWVNAPASMTVLKPRRLTFAEAATIPVTFLTAQYSLQQLGRIRKGHRVLLHAVTGGVGMAGTQLALRAGAEVFGTAGSPAKKALARALGVHHVSDSRSLSFVEDVMRDTNGEGVDIVINSLAGDFIPATLGLVRRGGHFIEIGKTGIWDPELVAKEYPGVTYHRFFLGDLLASRPQFVQYLLRELLVDFDSGAITPLPQRLYPLEKSEEAFRFMGQGLHTGKIVITQQPVPSVHADATYLVTGGLGGLGLVTARWLASEGARHLVLVGRSDPNAAAQETIAALEAQGVSVAIAAADVSDPAHVRHVLQQIAAGMPPLRGIIHAAGVLDDATLAEQTPERFHHALAPKAMGAWNLHELTARLPLDFFVMFSSGAAVLGSPGQANYAAANAFMDALAHTRHAQGLPAVSINWGGWSEVGMAAGVSAEHQRRWDAMGFRSIDPDTGMRMLGDVLYGTSAPQVVAFPLVRSQLPATLGPLFRDLVSQAPAAQAPAAANILQRLGAAPADERAGLVTAFLADQVVKVLALGPSARIDPARSLLEMGMDSLMAMELGNRMKASLNVTVTAAQLLQGTSIADLTDVVLSGMPQNGAGNRSGSATPSSVPASGADAWEEGSL